MNWGSGSGGPELAQRIAAILPDRCRCPINHDGRFPGLSKHDTQILRDCLNPNELRPDAWWFDVPVGPQPQWSQHVQLPRFYQSFDHLTKLRIDMICLTGQWTWCVEIKPEARSTALGQVLLNTFTLQHTLKTLTTVRPAILCRWACPELDLFCQHHHVLIHRVAGGDDLARARNTP